MAAPDPLDVLAGHDRSTLAGSGAAGVASLLGLSLRTKSQLQNVGGCQSMQALEGGSRQSSDQEDHGDWGVAFGRR